VGVYEEAYPEYQAGGFTRVDGTIQFYTRVNALLNPSMVVIDFGAGRGFASETGSPYHRALSSLQGKVARVIGIDVDPAVLYNPRLDQALVFDGEHIPLSSNSVDLVVSDNTFEHLRDPAQVAAELYRILRPGGWVCARTPYLYSLLVAASSMIPNRLHAKVLHSVQPGGREAHDVFPTTYKLNSMRALARSFPKEQWINCSYTWSPEPAYHFGSTIIVRLMRIYQYIKLPLARGEFLMVFLKKRVG
jgi:SAM-dependent methyltransferase